jgi:hypothetical protein
MLVDKCARCAMTSAVAKLASVATIVTAASRNPTRPGSNRATSPAMPDRTRATRVAGGWASGWLVGPSSAMAIPDSPATE